ncbi:copper(I)-binding protein [Nocardiopsis arvandica]|uniref:Copper(I)-binding protein n=1 Tax=Nocardiopsis sinuspersici TaxID=501010 RepID=A0A7Y9X9A0_9ACTN|nr:CHAT domain-containing protein [Nocardiopsis sinuspersici]NYH51398.1 copper(I)-binding protein [Nocardiopsis sinuspersici]
MNSGDATVVLVSEATQEFQRLAMFFRQNPTDLRVGQAVGWFHWLRHQALPDGQDQADMHGAILALTPCFLSGIEPLPEPLLPLLADEADPMAIDFLQQALSSTDTGLLTATVHVWKRMVEATPDGHPDQAGRLSNLGGALQTRFEHTGAMADLNETVIVGYQAVQATPDGHPDQAGHLSNLGGALQTRFRRTGDTADLNEAVTVGHQAVQATPDGDPNQAMYLSNLGGALQTRFEHTGAMADLNKAVTVGHQAVQATPDGHPGRAGRLSNLGWTLQARFEHTGAMADLNKAVTVGHQAVQATPDGDPNQAMYLSNLGEALQARFRRTSDAVDFDAAVTVFGDAWQVRSAPPTQRIEAGWALVRLVSGTDPVRATEVWQGVVEFLPQVVPRQLGRGDQQYELGRFSGLAGQAAAAVLSHPGLDERERAVRALAVVETGQGVLLSQALDTRSELTDLEHHAPDLADKYVRLRDLLDQPTPTTPPEHSAAEGDIPFSAIEASGEGGVEQARAREARLAQDRHRLVGDFDAVLEQIRAVEGFATFGLPPSAQELLKEAGEGPVVVVTTTPARCDALLLTATGVSHLELPDLTWNTLVEKVNAFHQAKAQARVTASADEGGDPQQVLTGILGWLWDVAAGPVLDALGFDTEPAGDEWPRVWWSPGGLLGQLPLHAAGHHSDPPGTRRTVMDCVVSSYTPTVRALRYAREQAARHEHGTDTREGALVVAMPTTPGQGALPFVRVEADKVRGHVPNAVVLTEVDTAPGSTVADALAVPTRAKVLEHLPKATIAHFACHGYTDPGDPSQSRLLLHDHAEDPLTVAALGAVRLDRAQLAYLSACSTASITQAELLDEAIHVASAFQLAGFPHVVGTLWEVNDQVSATVADLFYTHLRGAAGQAIDPTRAAHALHAAVRAMRDGTDLQDTLPGWDRIAAPLLWAPYLHTGA